MADPLAFMARMAMRAAQASQGLVDRRGHVGNWRHTVNRAQDPLVAVVGDQRGGLLPVGLEPGVQHHRIVVIAQGDNERFAMALAMSERDWRDSLVAADLANGDWPDRLDAELG